MLRKLLRNLKVCVHFVLYLVFEPLFTFQNFTRYEKEKVATKSSSRMKKKKDI